MRMKIKVIYFLTIIFFSLSLMTPQIIFDPLIGYDKIKKKYSWLTPQLYNFIYYESRRFNVPIEKICAIIQSESEGDQTATSKSKARGLMQIMPCHYTKGPAFVLIGTIKKFFTTKESVHAKE